MNLNPPGEHELLIFWVGLVAVVALARLLGLLARKVGQPPVIGELVPARSDGVTLVVR